MSDLVSQCTWGHVSVTLRNVEALFQFH